MNTDIKITPDQLKQCESLECDCGSQIYINAVIPKKVPGLLLGTTQTAVINCQVLICVGCHKIIEGQRDFINSPIKKINTIN